MLALATWLLTPGPKGFFENSAYLLGVPLLALGVLGALLVLTPLEIRWPQRQQRAVPAEVEELLPPPEGHPSAEVYVQVGAILAVLTALEVAVYYIDALEGALLGILLVFSTAKFALVALWFMHLRFDSRLFSVLFTGGLVLVAALFFVVLASLGASLV